MNKRTIIEKTMKVTAFLIGIAIVFTLIIGVVRVSGNEMYPALHEGDLCIYLRNCQAVTKDVVVYNYAGELRISRVAAVDGDRVTIRDGSLFVNEILMSEDIFYATECEEEISDHPVSGSFILNDYRENQNDSRLFSDIEDDEIHGKVILVVRFRGF